jgi:hypothetical protein
MNTIGFIFESRDLSNCEHIFCFITNRTFLFDKTIGITKRRQLNLYMRSKVKVTTELKRYKTFDGL